MCLHDVELCEAMCCRSLKTVLNNSVCGIINMVQDDLFSNFRQADWNIRGTTVSIKST